MREPFEKLPEIAELVDQFDFSEDTNTYHVRYDDMYNDGKRLDVMYLVGAWYAFQEVHKELEAQQKIINDLKDAMEDLLKWPNKRLRIMHLSGRHVIKSMLGMKI